MKSILVEYHRFDNLAQGVFGKDNRYILAAGKHRVREATMQMDHEDFLDCVLALRYQTSRESREAALRRIGNLASAFLGPDTLSDMRSSMELIQVDIVANPAELTALPFEAALDSNGNPLFVSSDTPVVVTRRVRHEFAPLFPRWPARPRVLFAWASPVGVGDVPHEDHELALRKALEPWLCPGEDGKALAILARATLRSLSDICASSVQGSNPDPFTHVHVLAHGYPVDYAHRQRIGVALHHPDDETRLAEVAPEQLVEALKPLLGHAATVTVMACDSGNQSNTITTQRSIAHKLHVAGFPIVLASQFPLTKVGSSIVVNSFYPALLSGTDVRKALHDARVKLYANKDKTGHDWVSLIGYAQLPEGYAEHLVSINLESILGAIKSVQSRSDRLLGSANAEADDYDQIVRILKDRLKSLETFLTESRASKSKGVAEENYGLLGSTEKRLAEVLHARNARLSKPQSDPSVREALERSRQWYRLGYENNLSHHWTAVQFLSLEAALTGCIETPGLWHAAMAAAKIDLARHPVSLDGTRPIDGIWALGSQLELLMLAPYAGLSPQLAEATQVWAQIHEAVNRQMKLDRFPIESTTRQLNRYVNWWVSGNGYFPGAEDLRTAAMSLVEGTSA